MNTNRNQWQKLKGYLAITFFILLAWDLGNPSFLTKNNFKCDHSPFQIYLSLSWYAEVSLNNGRLDQGLNEIYSCPTCRKPLFVGRSETESSSPNRAVSSDEQLAHQLSSGLDQPNAVGHGGVFPNENQTSLEANAWRLVYSLLGLFVVYLV